MKIKYSFLASLLLALVLTLSCSTDSDHNKPSRNSSGDGGITTESFGGTWDASGNRSIVFDGNTFNYKISGITMYFGTFSVSGTTITFNAIGLGTASGNFTLTGETLDLSNHTWDNSVNGTYTKAGGTEGSSSSRGNNNSSNSGGGNNNSSSSGGGNSNGQYCYFPEDDEDEAGCVLIGTSSHCFFSNATECQAVGGSAQTLAYCNANVSSSNIYGCDMGSCSLPSGFCIDNVPQSACISAGGTFNENSCPTEPGNDTGYCLYDRRCLIDVSQSMCNFYEGTFNKNSCPADPAIPSSGQYCYDGYGCDLIGTGSSCWVENAAECTEEGSTVKTYAWCAANADVIAGCIYNNYYGLSFSSLSKKTSKSLSKPLSKQLNKLKSLQK
ncbi:MAG: hypothetical protein LBC64_11055 [Fibromonadaceae bacterium]|jgi:hypothetical protein|nr:hypothetical protein [Fibromonadaceae bacterium]